MPATESGIGYCIDLFTVKFVDRSILICFRGIFYGSDSYRMDLGALGKAVRVITYWIGLSQYAYLE